MTALTVHKPVLKAEVVKYLAPAPGKRYVDATVGAAGHALALASAGAEVLGIDRDQEMLDIAYNNIEAAGMGSKITLKKGEFSRIRDLVTAHGWKAVDGILFDLGISSYHLDTPTRGFSFRFDAPLDMRVDRELAVSAKDLINGLGKKELVELFTRLGEEREAFRVATAIIKSRRLKPIETTGELARIAERAVGSSGKIHPATRIFQALRIAVNDELNELRVALPGTIELLSPKGLLAVISFHSLEDRIVKQTFTSLLEAKTAVAVTDKPIMATPEEVSDNARSRSAKLRIIRLVKEDLHEAN